jgi:hypothetical protein
MTNREHSAECFAADAGIAIGPILFIIAILGILAAAIAAGSGSFTAGTSTESNNTKAAALIQIAENLHVGMDRITMEGNIPIANVVINVSETNDSLDLFSPSGGGIAPPSTTLANTPGTDVWHFPTAILPGIGTATGSIVAMLNVPSGVCDAVNAKAIGGNQGANYDSAAIGDPTSSNLGDLTGNGKWPTGFAGNMIGCIANSSNTGGYWFYQVIAIQ